MKLSYLTYQFCRYPLDYCFEIASKYNFDGIEVWGGRPHAYAYDMNTNQINYIKKLKKKYSVEISMFTPEILAYPYSLSSRLKEERMDTIKYLIKSVEVASKIGTSKMQITLPHPGYNISKKFILETIVENLKKLCDRAEELYLFELVNSKALKSMIDIVVPTIENEPLSEYFDKLKDRMVYIHISNSDGKTEFHGELNLEGGVIPIEDVFNILKSYKYDGWYSIEILMPYFRDPELFLCQSKRIIDKILLKS